MRKRTDKIICGKFRNRPNTHTTERMWKQENTGEKAELPLLGFFTITYFDYTLAGSDKMSIFAEINTSQRQNEHRRRITN